MRLRCWCCLLPHGCSGRRRARPPARLGGLTSFGAAPRSPPVPSGPSGALHTGGAVSLCMAERVGSKPGQALPPPTGAAAWPSGTSGGLHTSGVGSLMCGLVSRLEDRPGPAAAHGHRSLAIRRLRCSPHGKRWGFCTTRSLLAACRRRVEPSCSAIPPIGAAAGRGYRVWVSCLEACSILSFACNSLMPAVCSSAKSPEFQRLHFKA